MKKFIFAICFLAGATMLSASEISDTFTQKYTALLPPENSSVHSDYLFQQIALGSEYTVLLLDQLNQSNADLGERVDTLIEKFDTIIEQNKKIIELLQKQNGSK
mgnify:CR=1 FL=1